jgi:acetyl esterase/lipase
VITTLLGLVGRLVLAAPGRGAPIERDGCVLDPQVRRLAKLGRSWRAPADATIAVRRAHDDRRATMLAPRPPRIDHADDVTLAGVPARVYVPRDRTGAALVYVHGGGWCFGSLATHDAICRVLAASARLAVIALAYRLAPEHRFPAALDDVIAGFRAAVVAAPRWQIDPARVAIGGDSAGANLAAAAAIELRHDTHPPAFQLLAYPSTDMTMSHASIESCSKGFVLERDDVVRNTSDYLGDADRRDPRASPLWAPDVAGVAPAFIATAGFDPLRDEGEAYAAKLGARHRRYASLVHGFMSYAGGVRAARTALAELAAELARGVA